MYLPGLLSDSVQLLEGIGIMSKSDASQASLHVNYQDNVNIGLDREHDIDATATEDEFVE